MSEFLLFLAGVLAGSAGTAAVLVPRFRARRATVQLLEARLAAGVKEHQSLQAELAAAQNSLNAQGAQVSAENAELRRRMDELADAIMRAGTPSGS